MLANVNLSNGTKLLANNGRVIVIGSRGEVTINPRELMGRRASIRAFTLWGITPEEEADIHAGLFAGLENGALPHRRQGTATRRSGACAQGDPRARVGWQDCTRLLNVWRRIPLHGRELRTTMN
jgi:NADPH:quinone reductase-like Zn-dependent oxidoreductase